MMAGVHREGRWSALKERSVQFGLTGAAVLFALTIWSATRADQQEAAKNATAKKATEVAIPVASACARDADVRRELGKACQDAEEVAETPVAEPTGGAEPPRRVIYIPSPGPTVTRSVPVTVTGPPEPAETVTEPGPTVTQPAPPPDTVTETQTRTRTATRTTSEPGSTTTTTRTATATTTEPGSTTTTTRTATATTTEPGPTATVTTTRPVLPLPVDKRSLWEKIVAWLDRRG